MSCLLCGSAHQAEFGSEILIHFRGLENLDNPPIWVFPKLLVCLDCGFSQFAVPRNELALLATGTATSEATAPQLEYAI